MHIRAYGVGVPGPVDQQAGTVKTPPVMPGRRHGYPIREALVEAWGRPVLLNNNANLGAFGEWAYGADPLLYIKVGSGIGAGWVIHGQIYCGATGSAGEIGHLTIVENGPRCTCGNRGCLEALAGGRAIARQAQEAVRAQQPTQLALIIGPPETLTAHEVALAARRGDLVAQQILRQAGEYLGIAVANLINLLNPAVVVFGSGVAQVGDLLLEPVRREVQRRSLPPWPRPPVSPRPCWGATPRR
ncbi:MAG TPA: ROK family protein [Anaerolineae bacterium]|nr:ROK family protein [Anaerolineae bacterium]